MKEAGWKEQRPMRYDEHFHTGYLMGVFDLFHTGHLNLIERAKEHCDLLIVGVLSDEIVYEQKGAYPVIPLDDRLRILSACRYVDKAVPVTDPGLSKVAEWNRLHFDCLFSGNDHEGNEMWEYERKELEKRGATIRFFSYTGGISTSLIKEKIRNDPQNAAK